MLIVENFFGTVYELQHKTIFVLSFHVSHFYHDVFVFVILVFNCEQSAFDLFLVFRFNDIVQAVIILEAVSWKCGVLRSIELKNLLVSNKFKCCFLFFCRLFLLSISLTSLSNIFDLLGAKVIFLLRHLIWEYFSLKLLKQIFELVYEDFVYVLSFSISDYNSALFRIIEYTLKQTYCVDNIRWHVRKRVDPVSM